jgi:hypothetical protein
MKEILSSFLFMCVKLLVDIFGSAISIKNTQYKIFILLKTLLML